MVGWNSDSQGQLDTPVGLSDVVSVAAGNNGFSLALKSDGTIVGWGKNFSGEHSIPPTLSRGRAVAVGDYASLALTGSRRR